MSLKGAFFNTVRFSSVTIYFRETKEADSKKLQWIAVARCLILTILSSLIIALFMLRVKSLAICSQNSVTIKSLLVKVEIKNENRARIGRGSGEDRARIG